MKMVLATLGAAFVVLWFFAEANIIDFKLCISPAGTCSVEVTR